MDPELEALKAQRLAEMQKQYGGQLGGMQSPEQQQQQEAEKQRMDEMKHNMLSQILTQEARTRLNYISLTKPAKAKEIESMLIQMARTGQIPGKLSEEQLKGVLEKVNQQTATTTTVKFDRRRNVLDSDDDDY